MSNKIKEKSRFLRKFDNGYFEEFRECVLSPGNIKGVLRAEVDAEGTVEAFENSYVVELNEDEVNDEVMDNYYLIVTKRAADQLSINPGKLYFIVPGKNINLIKFGTRKIEEKSKENVG